jgi:hypothetical protein
MSQDPAFDASIPVLTEIVHETPARAAPAPAAADAAVAEVIVSEAAPEEPLLSLEERAALAFGEEEWKALELRLCERIVHQLQGRVDFVLHQRLRDSMAEVLQHALVGLTEEIRGGLEQTIEQIVTRAVAQELAHLKTLH